MTGVLDIMRRWGLPLSSVVPEQPASGSPAEQHLQVAGTLTHTFTRNGHPSPATSTALTETKRHSGAMASLDLRPLASHSHLVPFRSRGNTSNLQNLSSPRSSPSPSGSSF
ncbi:hypothetical protein FOCG_05640 [Fusarium oxysporum f. sp. radicis-lycopersici 26381]|nr:hypothetical protein FOWG_03980 [Fusarium oxysporum f. sp. lycopersici MN25]EXL54842.1 hypothetical protein FOCG_05640 [Fusarium oxysporum f. sp. radicis-lycopersici 26381]